MENYLLRFSSILLSLAMVFNMLPHQALADVLSAEEQNLSVGTTEMEAVESANIVEEVIEKRSKYSKEFKLSNGLHMAAVYGNAVHFEKDGQWKEIDNTLIAAVSDGDSVYTNTEGVWNVSFPTQLSSEKRISLSKDGYTLQFGMAGALSNGGHMTMGANASQMSTDALITDETVSVQAAQISTAQIMQIDAPALLSGREHPEMIADKAASRLQYTGVYTDTNIVYDLQSNELKESVVIGHYDPSLCGYQYDLDVGSLIPVINEDNSIYFYDSKQENVVMVMPAPFMVDAENQYSFDVEVVLRGSGSSYTLIYLLPQAWMAEDDRVWPVVLDPIVSADLTRSNIRDICVAERYIDDNNAGVIGCGYANSWGAHRSFVKYSEIPEISSSDVIVGASMALVKYGEGASTTLTVEVHKVEDTWDSVGLTWSNMPDTDSTVEDYAHVVGWGYYYWDVTDIVREWYAGENTGMMFKATDAVETGGVTLYKEFYSSDYGYYYKPQLNIYFRNNNGLENYWDYTTSMAGRAGTGYINNYTGNLVWVRSDMGFNGNRMPVSINHVYNANDSLNNDFGLGYGWRTNYNQRVYSWSENSNYYIWEDGDGTKHYFLYDSSSGVYKDEDGLELVLDDYLEYNIWTYSITDKYGNIRYFDSRGRLGKMINNQATTSCIQIEYVSTDNRIAKIADGAGRMYTFSYSNGLLNRISYTGTDSSEESYVAFGYSGSQLTTITDKDAEIVTYAYTTNNLLSSVTDVDGYKLTYTYNIIETGKPSRVASVTEMHNGVTGGALTVSYGQNQTTFTDHNGNQQILQFNNWGNTVSVQDGQGRAQYAGYASNSMDDGGKGNQLTLSSKLQNTVANMLPDNSFEEGSTWTLIDSSVSQSNALTGYMGSRSLSVTRISAGAASGVCQSFTAAANTAYTFSAYVKTGAGTAYLELNDGSTTVTSETLAANSGWTRLQVSYTNSSGSTKTVTARLMTAQAGTVYMDCVQLEKAPTASRYNLIANGDFRNTSAWSSAAGRCAVAASAAPQLDNQVYKLTGSPTATNRISQTVHISGSAGDTFVLAGWGKAQSVPLTADEDNPRQFSLIAEFVDASGSKEKFELQFNPYVDNWQYAAKAIVPTRAYSSVTVSVAYDYNANEAYFDGIQLYKEEFGSSYTYDEDGNIVSVVDLQKKETTYEYASNNLTKIIEDGKTKMTYTYDSYHNVLTAASAEGLIYEFTYDTYGNNTSVTISSGGVSMTSSAAYSTDGNLLLSTTDAAGNKTEYEYDADTNMLVSVQYPEGGQTTYTYDSMYRLATASASAGGQNLSAVYTYENDLLKTLTTESTTYSFGYGNFGLRSSIKVGATTLATYTYTDRNNYLNTLAYGNGDRVQYTYDNYGRVTKETYEDGDTVTYAYDNDGALATVTDSATGRTTTYYYDFTDRLMKYVEQGSGFSHSVGYTYDTLNNLTRLVETINGVSRTTSYAYDEDNRITGVTTGSSSRTYTYDGFGRIVSRVTSHGTTTISSETVTYLTNGNNATGQVGTLTNKAGEFGYTYDANGNIKTVTFGGKTTTYTYDSQNQLVREDNEAAVRTWTWTYDDAGNILSKKEYLYTDPQLSTGPLRGIATYSYGNANWGDLLTSYGGQSFSSDAIGNLTYDGTWTYNWEHGRELVSMTYAPRIRIISQPQDYYGALNDTVTFSVVAEGTGLTYQWQWRAYNSAWSNSPVAGNQTATLTMPLTENRNGLEYRCVITDSAGNQVETEPAKVKVTPITITVQPQHVTGSVGGECTMTVAAEGSGFTYQWQWRADSSCAWGNSPLPGNQTASMTIPFTLDRIGNQYRCVITDANGNSVASDYGEMRLADNNWTFTYDANGMRTSRTNGVTTYGYIYNGDKLSKMSVPYHTMEFTYDANGNPFSLIYNGDTYYYVTNLQGDVVAIVGSGGTVVVRYTYDAWGRVLTISGGLAMSIGHLNPLRYRGYVYDHETRLYYLQSRYYDPEMGRFLNADAFASTGQGLLGNNMFAYCGNNPVTRKDSAGTTYVFLDEFIAEVDPDGQFDEGGAGGGYGLGVKPSYYTAQRVQDYDSNWQNSGYNQNPTGPSGTSACFIAGTLVQCEDGTKPIEEIESGDLVWAYDEETGDVALKEVVEAYVNETSELVHIFVNGEEVVSTPTHPFYSPIKGWTEAVKLRAGDILVLVNGEYVVVEKVQHEILEAPVTVYNFQVEDYHTYYVGEICALVHNSCGTPENLSPTGAGRNGAFNQAKRDSGIPVSQQPDAVLPNYDKRGNLVPGRVYVFGEIYIRDDVMGHTYRDGGFVPRHFNTPDGGHYFY